MCSFATGAGPRGMTSAIGSARVRVVTLEKELIFCPCTVSALCRNLLFILIDCGHGSPQFGSAANGSSFMRRSYLHGPRLQSGHQRRQGANILRDPTGAACDRNGNAGVEAVIGGSSILANIDSHLVPKSLIYMLPARDPSDQTGLASIEDDNDLGWNALGAFHLLQSLGNLTQPGNVIQPGNDGEIANREDLVRPIKPSRRHIDDHEIILL